MIGAARRAPCEQHILRALSFPGWRALPQMFEPECRQHQQMALLPPLGARQSEGSEFISMRGAFPQKSKVIFEARRRLIGC